MHFPADFDDDMDTEFVDDCSMSIPLLPLPVEADVRGPCTYRALPGSARADDDADDNDVDQHFVDDDGVGDDVVYTRTHGAFAAMLRSSRPGSADDDDDDVDSDFADDAGDDVDQPRT